MKFLQSSFWLHSIFYTLLQRFSLFFFGAVSFMVIVRGFDKQENAIWSLYVVLLTLIEMIKQGLLRNPTIKFLAVSENAEKKKEVQSAALVINIIFSLIAIAVLTAGSGIISSLLKSSQLQPLLWWSTIYILLLIPFNHCEVLMQAHYKFRQVFWAYFIRQGILFFGIVIIFFFFPTHFTLMNLVFLQLAALLAGVIVIYFIARPFLVTRFHHDKKITAGMLHFGKYIFGTNLFSSVSRSFDHFITASLLDPVTGKNYVSYYNTVGRINNMIDVPSLAAADVLYPKNVETLETDGLGKVKYYFERMVASLLAIIIPLSVFVFFFPRTVIMVLSGPEYLGAVPILQMTILFNLVRPLGYQFGSTLDAIGKPAVNFWINCLFMTISLVLNFIFLNWFGGIGAAYASIVSYTISFLIMIAVLKKYVHIELLRIAGYILQTYKDIFRFGRRVMHGSHGS